MPTEPPIFCLVGPLPPPLHGVSAVNKAVLDLALAARTNVHVFNTAAVTLDRGLANRLRRHGRSARAIFGVATILRKTRSATVYLSISGGIGVLSDLPVICLARAHGAKIVLHHHSFKHLDQSSSLMRKLTQFAGTNATHIVLSASMERALRASYPGVKNTLIVSNAAFFDLPTLSLSPPHPQCLVIGHLSNLSSEKGVFDVLKLAKWSEKNQPGLEFQIAGPVASGSVVDRFMAEARGLKNLVLRGPVYGDDKRRFFEEIDAFVFPTRYVNEAEPLVLLEALSHGRPVISYDRGCISSLVDDSCGALARKDEEFLPFASKILLQWKADANAHLKRQVAAREKFNKLHEGAAAGKQRLLELLCAK